MKTLTDVVAVVVGAGIFALIAVFHIGMLALPVVAGIYAAKAMGWL